MSKIFDNIAAKFEAGLHDILSNVGVERADFCVGYFNLRGWNHVAADVASLPGGDAMEKNDRGIFVPVKRYCRLLVGMQRPNADLIREMYSFEKTQPDFEKVRRWRRQVAADFRRQLTLGIPTAEDEETLRTLRWQLTDGKVCVKLHLRHPLHAKLYLAHRPKDTSNPVMSIMGSSNLTFSGMKGNGELNAEFGDFHDNQKYARWFDDRWNDTFSVDITQDLIDALDACWASIEGPTPYEVYLKIMYHLSREARRGVSEYHLPAPFDKELFDFQKTAVKLAVRHLEKRGGAMIGDVVGLGKTITACAIAKFYEESVGVSTLVICPPNLRPMWREYADRYDLKMGDMSVADQFDVRKVRHYHLVIIDESHNLRNGEGQRYARIKDLLAYQGNKVLLLTATPYNKDFSDLANQLKLFVDPDEDLGIRPEQQIKEEGGEQAFAMKHSNVPLSSIGAFEKSFFSDDWRDLMKLFLVRRTRTFIKKHYALTDKRTGRKYLKMKDGTLNYFPDRIPKTVKFKTSPGDMFERLYCERMVDWMGSLSLPRYGLQKYINDEVAKEAEPKEKQVLENLSRAGKRMMGFCRSGFYKRMDSSGVAFLMSLYRHAVRNAMYLHAIRKGLDLPLRAGVELDDGWLEEDDGEEVLFKFPTEASIYAQKGKEAYEAVVAKGGSSVRWISTRFFKRSLAAALKKDNETIMSMLGQCGEWNPAKDEKLNALQKIIAKKHGDEKVLVFTQFSDTARYVGEQLKARGIANLVQVDGDSEDIIAAVRRFSPVSNHMPPVPIERQTRVMVSTDVLSEGQNLQDAHVVVNFDLPWAIIRLIQRAGRVDRIGQKAAQVYCYSFFPQEGINEVIRLRDRLKARIRDNAETVGSDEVFFEGSNQSLKDIFTEKAGVLDESEDEEVDLASQAFQVWESATKDNPELRDRIQGMADVVYSTKPAGKDNAGVITYARTKSDNDVLVWLNASGGVESQSAGKIFQALACSAATPKLPPLANHHGLVAQAVAAISDPVQNATVGVLGSKSSTKYRVYALLKHRLEENPMPLLEQNLKAAADQVYAYPMKESAKSALGKMFQKHLPADDIIQTILELHKSGDLCLVPDDDDPSPHAARIICSMGLSKEN
ncbi:MAG: helicase [Kiritimatiellae bacterium]|nr:helicase [Kiritimatiellia bacterium]